MKVTNIHTVVTVAYEGNLYKRVHPAQWFRCSSVGAMTDWIPYHNKDNVPLLDELDAAYAKLQKQHPLLLTLDNPLLEELR